MNITSFIVYQKKSNLIPSAINFSTRKVAILSSCRIQGVSPASYIHQVHHTHNTKETIQYIKYIMGDIDIKREMHRYVFRSCFLDNDFIIDRDQLKNEFLLSDVVFVEICSRKKYLMKGYFIHHLAADKGDAPSNNLIEQEERNENYVLTIQSEDEIEADILTIKKLMTDKIVIFVTHIDYGIETRKVLIDQIDRICKKHKLFCINPIR
jgi:hypothetical protein